MSDTKPDSGFSICPRLDKEKPYYMLYSYHDTLHEASEKENQIIQNQLLREKIVDLADLWDGKESLKYGQRLQDVLEGLGIDDCPDYSLDDEVVKELVEMTKGETS